jgi:hypothetical protein
MTKYPLVLSQKMTGHADHLVAFVVYRARLAADVSCVAVGSLELLAHFPAPGAARPDLADDDAVPVSGARRKSVCGEWGYQNGLSCSAAFHLELELLDC